MKRGAALAVLLLLTACAGDPPPRRAAPAGPTPSAAGTGATTATATVAPASAAPASAAPPGTRAAGGLLVAVVRRSGGLELHRVDRGSRAASLERVLAPPPEGGKAVEVALSATQVCATWHLGEGEPFQGTDPQTSLVCYPAGSSTGRVVEGPATPVEVALSEDGTRLAWAQLSQGDNQAVTTARITDGVLSASRRFLARADQPEGGQSFIGTSVQALAWVDRDELAISTVVESDDSPKLLRFDVAAPGKRGWLDEGEAVEVQTERYLTYDGVVSVDGRSALAVERGSYLDQAAPPGRAVRVDLTTGRVLQVLATAAQGRTMETVSGSRDAALYATAAGEEPLKTYLRLAGERRGVPVTGLPDDVEHVVTRG